MEMNISVPRRRFDPALKPRDSKKSVFLLREMLNAFHWQCTKCGRTAAPETTRTPRLETFAGPILGANSGKRVGARSVEFPDGKRFKINDPHGPSGLIEFEAIASQFRKKYYPELFLAIAHEAKLFLREMLQLPASSATHLQCNINAYRSGSEMDWHRDDVEVKAGEDPPTFHPAAATLLLLDETLTNMQPNGSAPFQFCPPPRDKSGGWRDRHEPRGSEPDDILSLNEEFVFFGLHGADYLHGVHRASADWFEPEPGNSRPFRRISLNFRLVKDEAWERFAPQPGAKVPTRPLQKPGPECACFTDS